MCPFFIPWTNLSILHLSAYFNFLVLESVSRNLSLSICFHHLFLLLLLFSLHVYVRRDPRLRASACQSVDHRSPTSGLQISTAVGYSPRPALKLLIFQGS